MFHRFTVFRNEHISNVLVCFIPFQSFLYISSLFHLLWNGLIKKRNGLIKKNKISWLRKVSVSLLRFVSPCFVTSTDQGVWTVSSCFVTNEMNETDHQWELLLVCFICVILFQSILEYSLYILIVLSVPVTEKKTGPKKTCMDFCAVSNLLQDITFWGQEITGNKNHCHHKIMTRRSIFRQVKILYDTGSPQILYPFHCPFLEKFRYFFS